MTRKPVRKPARAAGPINQSRGAGAPAPASAAATAPAFYEPAAGNSHSGAQSAPEAAIATHAAAVRRQAIPIEDSPGTADVSLAEQGPVDGEDAAAAIARIRKMRRPLGVYSQKLALDERRSYHRHWFNDTAGRVAEAEANGWSHVKDQGKPLKRVVGVGRDNGALYAYAMEIPEVFWLEDMAARHTAAAQVIESTKANPFKAAPGQAKSSDGGKFYSPQEAAGPLQVVKA